MLSMSYPTIWLTRRWTAVAFHRPPSIVHRPLSTAPCSLSAPASNICSVHTTTRSADYPARRPALVAMTPSAVDPTIVPPGKHSLYIWAQYHPYAPRGRPNRGTTYASAEADRLIETLAEYAPNIAGAITHRYIQSPLDLERNLGMRRGNIMHIDMSLDQMFMFRPLPQLSGYKTPIRGLYLTGASTHPGGGVSGASGRNAASVVLADLQERRSIWRGAALVGAVAVGATLVRRRKGKERQQGT